ncbi:MAG: PilW family protein [Planctomycetia bacterium]|jgi:hypothetical protein
MIGCRRPTRRTRSGFTLLEVAITSSVLFLVTAALVQQLEATRRLAMTARTGERLHASGTAALKSVGEELRRSARTWVGGVEYPLLCVDGDPGAGPAYLAHEGAIENAAPDEVDHGPNVAVAFAVPTMRRLAEGLDGLNYCLDCSEEEFDDGSGGATQGDGDEPLGMYHDPEGSDGEYRRVYHAPYIDPGTGLVRWSDEVASLAVVADARGRNTLELRVGGARTKTLARDVERIVCDTSATDPVGVPVGAVRVRLWLRARDETGALQRWSGESIVHLRNE